MKKYEDENIVYKDYGCNYKIVKDLDKSEYVIYDEEIDRNSSFETAYSELNKLRQNI